MKTMNFFEKKDIALLGKAKQMVRAAMHPLRQTILALIKQHKSIRVTDIYKNLKIEQSVASQQLGILRRANLVNTKRQGKTILYSVNEASVNHLLKTCEKLVA
jgi:DNA-binding transcriptional ArsR family regulator